jgi:hypothetical protein
MRSIQKLDRELNKKAKAQQKRQRKIERRKAAKALPNPGANGPISPFAESKKARCWRLEPVSLDAAGDNSPKESTANDL